MMTAEKRAALEQLRKEYQIVFLKKSPGMIGPQITEVFSAPFTSRDESRTMTAGKVKTIRQQQSRGKSKRSS